MIELTKDEAECIANHLELSIIQELKDTPEYDSIEYLCTLCRIYERCRKEAKDADREQ